MKIIKINNTLHIELDDGTTYHVDDCSEEFFEKVQEAKNEKELKYLFYPELKAVESLIDRVKKSKIVSIENNSLYIKSICNLTLPQTFAQKVLEAEEANDQDRLQTYLNFWTLLSLNPDSNVRRNIFWFINKWDIKITKSGLLIAYKNVDILNKGEMYNIALTKFVIKKYEEKNNSKLDTPENYIVVARGNDYFVCDSSLELEEGMICLGDLTDLYNYIICDTTKKTPMFTDNYSKTFRIKLGHIVQMPREDCDSDQRRTCSRGLHCASKGWLTRNYCGNVGLRVLVNPADVVAVPPEDNYGKMRTCAYYPVSVIDYKKNGTIEDTISDGFEDDFLSKICYTGPVNNEDNDNYTLHIPTDTYIDKHALYKKLKNIASSINHED